MTKAQLENLYEELKEEHEELQSQYDDLDLAYAELENKLADLHMDTTLNLSDMKFRLASENLLTRELEEFLDNYAKFHTIQYLT